MEANRFKPQEAVVQSLRAFDTRRMRLGMSYRALAKRSNVSEPTLKRVLHGKSPEASFSTVLAIAEALGVSLQFEDQSVHQMKEDAASQKAKWIAGMVQATSGLESQAVDAATLDEITSMIKHKLMAGSARQLWNE